VRVQQLTLGIRVALLAGAIAAAGVSRAVADPLDDETTGGALVRYFTDSDHVLVRSVMNDWLLPVLGNASLSLHWNNERVTIPAISAPAGSQEAIDAITTASRPISGNAYQDFVKVRNEVESELTRGPAAVQYYVSKESDYLAQQLGAHYDRDFMDDLFNLSLGTSYAWDEIEPLADDDTNTGRNHKTTLHWNAVGTRVLTPSTMLRLGIELNLVNGLQHNPYRNVYAGGIYVPERHPDHRQRRDAFLKLNQYLPNQSSLKLSYRFYTDDWGILSHELDSKLNQVITRAFSARYEYRYYTQTAASFYRDEYPTPYGIDGYLSNDYRMADLSSHLFGAALSVDLETLLASHRTMRGMAFRVNYERYFNSNNYSANIVETGLDVRF